MQFKLLFLLPSLCYAWSLLNTSEQHIPNHINTSAPQKGKISLPYVGNPSSFHPRPQNNATYPGINELVFETLLKEDAPGRFSTLLADKVIITDNTITLSIDPQARFQNNKPIEASDVLYSLQQFQKTPTHYQLQHLASQISPNIINHKTVSFPVDNVEDTLLLLTKLPIIPINQHYDDLIGSGPYCLKYLKKKSIAYARCPTYWGKTHPKNIGRYNFNRVTYRFFSSTSAARQAFQNNKIDFYLANSAFDWGHQKPKTQNIYAILPHPNQHYTQLLWMNPQPPMDDPSVRQVISTILLPDHLNQWLHQGHYTSKKTNHHYKTALRSALSQSALLLDKSGWKMSGGKRYKDGKPLMIDAMVYHHSWDAVLGLLQHHCQRLGITLRIKHLNKAHYLHQLDQAQYHLVIEPVNIDTQQCLPVDKSPLPNYLLSPKTKVLYPHYQNDATGHVILKAILHELESDILIKPLWSIDTFRVGHNRRLKYYHQNQSFIDVFSWWYE